MNRAFIDIYQRLLSHFGPQDWWPGETPFEVMVGAILTQNTAWSNVERAIANLKATEALNGAVILELPDAELADLIRPAGYFNVKTTRLKALCRFLHDEAVLDAPEHLAEKAPLPELRQRLLAVHGVGEETADSILLYALNLPSFVVDAYTRRIFGRLQLLTNKESYGEIRAAFMDNLTTEVGIFNEYHALIVQLGKGTCRPKPHCGICPLLPKCPA